MEFGFIEVLGGGALGAGAAEVLRWAHRLHTGRLPRSRKGYLRHLLSSALLILGGGLVASVHYTRVEDLLIAAQLGVSAPALIRAWASSTEITAAAFGPDAHAFDPSSDSRGDDETLEYGTWRNALRW